MRLPHPAPLVLLAALVAGTGWLAQRGRDDAAPPAAVESAQPAFYLREALLEQTDATGRVELRIAAAHALQDPATLGVHFETLRVDYLLSGPPRAWVMTADSGTVPPDSRVVQLRGDVRLRGFEPGLEPGLDQAATIRTERLQLDAERGLATTEDPVRIELAAHALEARGLRADLKADRVQLKSEVHGHFRP